jgi:hypothetical protein
MQGLSITHIVRQRVNLLLQLRPGHQRDARLVHAPLVRAGQWSGGVRPVEAPARAFIRYLRGGGEGSGVIG